MGFKENVNDGMSSEFERKINEEFERQKNNIKKPNLMIVGGTGVGKSSLINKIFGENIAKTGTGKPITQGIKKYDDTKTPIIIYDSEGYELSIDGELSNNNFRQNIIPKIKEMDSKEIAEQIHIVWYCLSVSNKRITDFDIDNINLLIKLNKKIAIVLTKCDCDSETDDGKGEIAEKFIAIIGEKINKTISIFETTINTNLKLDFDKLIKWSIEELPLESLRNGFVIAQLYSIEDKISLANKSVLGFASASAIAAGLNPFPFSDSLLLIPIQTSMLITIAKIFRFDSTTEQVIDFLKTQIVSIIGKQIAASLTKFIPILGQIINAIIASTITSAMGFTFIKLYSIAYENFLKTGKLPDWIELFSSFGEIFNQIFTERNQKNNR